MADSKAEQDTKAFNEWISSGLNIIKQDVIRPLDERKLTAGLWKQLFIRLYKKLSSFEINEAKNELETFDIRSETDVLGLHYFCCGHLHYFLNNAERNLDEFKKNVKAIFYYLDLIDEIEYQLSDEDDQEELEEEVEGTMKPNKSKKQEKTEKKVEFKEEKKKNKKSKVIEDE